MQKKHWWAPERMVTVTGLKREFMQPVEVTPFNNRRTALVCMNTSPHYIDYQVSPHLLKKATLVEIPFAPIQKLAIEARATRLVLDLTVSGQDRIRTSYDKRTGQFTKPFEEFTVPNMFGSGPR